MYRIYCECEYKSAREFNKIRKIRGYTPYDSHSYVCLPYEIPYEKAATPNTDFFQLFRIVFSKFNTLAIVTFKF